MTIAVVQSIELLVQTATDRLTAEIKAETNPDRLVTLLGLAFKARLPRIPAAPASPRTPPDPAAPRTSSVPQPDRAIGSERAREPEATQPICKTDPPPSSLSTDRANGAEPRASEGEAAQSSKINRSVCKTASCPEPAVTQPGLQDRHQSPPPRLSSRDSSLVTHPSSSPNAADDVEDEVADEDEHAPTDEGLPHYLTPMTDAEFLKLQREIGHVEANRRRLIRAHLASNHARNAADSS